MRIVTFNIQHGRTPAGRVDVDLVARVCKGFDADVLALQEVDVRRRRSGWVNTVERIRAETGLHGMFGPAIRGYGNALFSTQPITDVTNHRLPRHGRREPRALLLATTHGIRVGVTHLSIDEAEARTQLAAVLDGYRPDLLLGDLNLRTDQLAHVEGLVQTGGPTWPADAPRIRIDHAIVATTTTTTTTTTTPTRLRVTAAQALPAPPVSDHLPLLLEAEISRG
jgi:endonuclease/exonuclease/phosphatase family metal-dependent hydrolase